MTPSTRMTYDNDQDQDPDQDQDQDPDQAYTQATFKLKPSICVTFGVTTCV